MKKYGFKSVKKYGFKNVNKYGFESVKKYGFKNTTSQSLNRIALIEAIIVKKEIEQSESYIVYLFLYRQLMKAYQACLTVCW